MARWSYGMLCSLALFVFAAAASASQPRHAAPPAPPPFQIWLAELIEEARRRDFDRDLVDETLSRLQPLPRVIKADRAQAAPNAGLDAYLSARLSAALVTRGREMMRDHRDLLARIERWFGVHSRFLVAIWGAETGYGPYSGDVPVFQ